MSNLIKLKQIQGGLVLQQDVNRLKNLVEHESTGLVVLTNDLKSKVEKLNGGVEVVGSVAHSVAQAKNELKSDVARLDAKDVELQGKITANEGEIANLKSKDVELEGKITVNEGEIVKLHAKDAELDGKIATNAAAANKAVSDLDAKLSKEIADTNAEVERVEGKVDAVDTKVDGLAQKTTQDIATAKGEAINAAKEYTNQKIEETSNNVSDIEGRVSTLEGEMDSVEAGLAKEISDREAADRTLQTNIDGVAGRATALEGRMDTVEGEVVRVEGKVDALTTATTQNIAKALEQAKSYTDEREVVINKAIADGDAATLASAKEFTTTSVEAGVQEAKTYAEEKVAGLKGEMVSPAEGHALDVKFGNVIVSGDLEVKGSINSIDKTELHVQDSIIEVNSNGADVTSSDIHLGLRANLGNGNFSEIVYCPDTQKWVIVDNHPKTVARHGEELVTRTVAFQEDVESNNAELNQKLEAVTGRVGTLEGEMDSAEGRLDVVEGEIAKLQAVQNISERIAMPGATMNLAKTPFDGKVELYVNGLLYVEGFQVSGNVITWNGQFELELDDIVVAKYVIK